MKPEIFIFGLLIYHIFLIINNITTSEHIKKMWIFDSRNPYNM